MEYLYYKISRQSVHNINGISHDQRVEYLVLLVSLGNNHRSLLTECVSVDTSCAGRHTYDRQMVLPINIVTITRVWEQWRFEFRKRSRIAHWDSFIRAGM